MYEQENYNMTFLPHKSDLISKKSKDPVCHGKRETSPKIKFALEMGCYFSCVLYNMAM